jgi:hypothetical protein
LYVVLCSVGGCGSVEVGVVVDGRGDLHLGGDELWRKRGSCDGRGAYVLQPDRVSVYGVYTGVDNDPPPPVFIRAATRLEVDTIPTQSLSPHPTLSSSETSHCGRRDVRLVWLPL